MSQYRHLIILGGSEDGMPSDAFMNVGDHLDSIGEDGYRMIDYFELSHMTVLIFEKGGASRVIDLQRAAQQLGDAT